MPTYETGGVKFPTADAAEEYDRDRDRFLDELESNSDEQVLERCAQFAQEYQDRIKKHTARGWGRIGDRLHKECAQRGLLHA